jgi:hypothetical protein
VTTDLVYWDTIGKCRIQKRIPNANRKWILLHLSTTLVYNFYILATSLRLQMKLVTEESLLKQTSKAVLGMNW